MTRATSFQRGASAKRKGRSLESNPFAKRPGNGNRKKANEWALGWHSCEVSARPSGGSGGTFQWPPLARMPAPPEGDYDRRCRGLRALMRPTDPIEWEVLRAELAVGRVGYVPHWAVVGYTILWFYAEARNQDIGIEPDFGWERTGHPMLYLYSALRNQGGDCSRWPPLVVSAFEELA